MNNSNVIGNNVEKLNINHEDQFLSYFERSSKEALERLLDAHEIPFIILSTCACGCGRIDYQIARHIAPRNEAIRILRALADKEERELAKQN